MTRNIAIVTVWSAMIWATLYVWEMQLAGSVVQ